MLNFKRRHWLLTASAVFALLDFSACGDPENLKKDPAPVADRGVSQLDPAPSPVLSQKEQESSLPVETTSVPSAAPCQPPTGVGPTDQVAVKEAAKNFQAVAEKTLASDRPVVPQARRNPALVMRTQTQEGTFQGGMTIIRGGPDAPSFLKPGQLYGVTIGHSFDHPGVSKIAYDISDANGRIVTRTAGFKGHVDEGGLVYVPLVESDLERDHETPVRPKSLPLTQAVNLRMIGYPAYVFSKGGKVLAPATLNGTIVSATEAPAKALEGMVKNNGKEKEHGSVYTVAVSPKDRPKFVYGDQSDGYSGGSVIDDEGRFVGAVSASQQTPEEPAGFLIATAFHPGPST